MAYTTVEKEKGKDKQIESNFSNGESLPVSAPIDFFVISDAPEYLSIVNKQLKTSIGKPFDLSLKFSDQFENPTNPDTSVGLPVLSINEFVFLFLRQII